MSKQQIKRMSIYPTEKQYLFIDKKSKEDGITMNGYLKNVLNNLMKEE